MSELTFSTRLMGRHALVTGATCNIGLASARRLGAEGASVTVTDIDPEACSRVVRELHDVGVDALGIPGDLTDERAIEAIFSTSLDWRGPVTALVNNAALTPVRHPSLFELDTVTWDAYFAVNVRAAFMCSLLASRQMRDTGGGSIVNVSSLGASRAHHGMVAYDSTKGALEAMTRAMAVELAECGIRVNAVAPASVLTDRFAQLSAEQKAQWAAPVPLGRPAALEEIATAIAFLSSDEASYITGAVIAIDGGLSAQSRPRDPRKGSGTN